MIRELHLSPWETQTTVCSSTCLPFLDVISEASETPETLPPKNDSPRRDRNHHRAIVPMTKHGELISDLN
jgi:hypothetical protein